jgi:hypothetical protein
MLTACHTLEKRGSCSPHFALFSFFVEKRKKVEKEGEKNKLDS